MFNLESKTCFHLRITASSEKSKEVMMIFIAKYKPKSCITGHETSKEGVEHSHTHLEFDDAGYQYHISDKGKTSRSSFFKKLELAGLYNFQKVEKTALQNIQYCIKDDHIIFGLNMNQPQIEEIKKMVVEIQKSMKMEQRNKLLEAFREAHKHISRTILKAIGPLDDGFIEVCNPEYPSKLHEIAEWIHWHYIDVYDKPPPIIHMREYVLWIASKQCNMDTKSYYFNMFKE